jgi:DNA-binding XRE family transcriptional regulator
MTSFAAASQHVQNVQNESRKSTLSERSQQWLPDRVIDHVVRAALLFCGVPRHALPPVPKFYVLYYGFIYYTTLVFNVGQQEESTMSEAIYIGRKLKETRVRRLLTQEELAEKAGVSPSTIVNIERDQTVPHFRTIRKLAHALDVDPTSLLGR